MAFPIDSKSALISKVIEISIPCSVLALVLALGACSASGDGTVSGSSTNVLGGSSSGTDTNTDTNTTDTDTDTDSASGSSGQLLGGSNSQELPGELDTAIGPVWVYGDASRTLYTFADDVAGQSTCEGSCASIWPPLLATQTQSDDNNFSTIARSNGDLQWAFKNRPLYYYEGDAAHGEVMARTLVKNGL